MRIMKKYLLGGAVVVLLTGGALAYRAVTLVPGKICCPLSGKVICDNPCGCCGSEEPATSAKTNP